ncbi:hypothetical protein ACHAWF_002655 [Thalassiosira exigua]
MASRRSTRARGFALVTALSLLAASHSFQQPSRSHPRAVRRGLRSPPRPSRHLPPATSVGPSGAPSRGPSTLRPRPATSLGAASPAAALAAIGSPLGSVAVLAFVILVHEAGHFLAARSLGIRVEEFSVGVGPRIAGVRRRVADDAFVFERIDDAAPSEGEGGEVASTGDDEIEFSLRALPLGGYVRFPENYNRTLAFEQEEVARKARNAARLMRVEGAAAWEKALESLAAYSFVFNALSLGLLKKWQSKREEDQLRRAEEEAPRSPGMGKGGAGGKSFWSALPWASTKKDVKEEMGKKEELEILRAARAPDVDYFDDPDLLQNRPWQERAVVLSGGVVFNILLAFSCYLGQLSGTRGLPTPVFDAGAVVSQTPGKDSPSFGVLERGDVIVGVNGAITSAAESRSNVWASQKEISNVISAVRGTPDGESVTLTIVHGGTSAQERGSVSVVPRRNDDGVVSIGIMLGPNFVRTDFVRASSVVDAVAKAGSSVYELTSETARSIFGLLAGFAFGKGLPAGTSMSGPIGVVKTGAQVVSQSDFAAVVAFAASISINLAVVNSLPLPALDGGQLLFVLAEAAAGQRIDQRVQESINAGALLVLLFISFGTAVGDVTSIFR